MNKKNFSIQPRLIRNMILAMLLAVNMLVMAPAFPAHAASYVVSNLNDTGAGSLRQAITDAMASPEADTITFSVSGTIALASQLPNITAAGGTLTIDGTGQTISGPGASCSTCFRVFYVTSGALTLSNLTVTNGYPKTANGHGGAIYQQGGTLNVTGSTFSNNSARSAATYNKGGAIFQGGGALNITNSTFSNNDTNDAGGAIYQDGGTLNVTGSTISNNTADGELNSRGGAIFVYNNAAPTIINSSTFSGNSTLASGGAIVNRSSTQVTNSTFSGNSASVQGGGIYAQNTLAVTHSTFSGNSAGSGGGGIYVDGSTTLRNTIIANSTGSNCAYGFFPPTDGGYNLQYGGSTANSCGATIPTADPKLLALADNGGPTWTFALGNGSAALEQIPAGTNGCGTTYTTDQRGYVRPGTKPRFRTFRIE